MLAGGSCYQSTLGLAKAADHDDIWDCHHGLYTWLVLLIAWWLGSEMQYQKTQLPNKGGIDFASPSIELREIAQLYFYHILLGKQSLNQSQLKGMVTKLCLPMLEVQQKSQPSSIHPCKAYKILPEFNRALWFFNIGKLEQKH